MLRYSMASIVSLVVSVICLAIFVGPLGMQAWVGATLATAIASIPSYYLNRRWAWGKSGKSHFMKEVVPFWSLAFLGWGSPPCASTSWASTPTITGTPISSGQGR
jgi:putative flippase GtrA